MGKFHYRLENVLAIKVKLEKQKNLEYSHAKRLVKEQALHISLLNQEKAHYLNLSRGNLNSKTNPHKHMEYSNYILGLSREITKESGVLVALEKEAQIAQEALIFAARERKTLETLKTHAYEAYLKDQNRINQRLSDELINSWFN